MCKLKKWGLDHKIFLAYLAFLAGIGFGIAGLVIPPAGYISSSVLILIAQLFVLSGTFIGLDVKFDVQNKYFHARPSSSDVKQDLQEIEKAVNEQYGEINNP